MKRTPPASMTRPKPTDKPEPRRSPALAAKPDRLPSYSGGTSTSKKG